MTDDPYLLRIDEYLDEDVSASEREEIERHLETCEACRAEVDAYRRLRRLALAAPPVPVPDDLDFRIRRRLAEVSPPPGPRSKVLRLLPLAAGAAAAAALLFMLLPAGLRPGAPPVSGGGQPVAIGVDKSAGRSGSADLEQTLGDWLLMAENADREEALVLAGEAVDLDLLLRVRRVLPGARGERRRWLRASEDLLVQLLNGPEAGTLSEEARLVAEVRP